ncbi:hypothetical protein PTTG_12096 [Puccinia triticina 1-1 BBBD Race 1]|uniref:Uncharacterized protein n=2 Tax=Puccinia triticina TaxID=208348 RepID=A0A180G2Y1_PUCT1|nr:uncharacterized protein PtA15_3A255 [Puccinia triticina]OAV86994.1 hypothetical protein PTTG_12096 [Puccinia triticina 1-1 BBBD Race 1]WAQ82890.1 hypothetical protein PtA15_3A255 [Puccinia triticina]WAR53716.1 hypothetical protein PtB15_3B225 [Puccinia triticina]
MFASLSHSVVFFAFISSQVLGRAVPQSGSPYQESQSLQSIIADYSAELATQDQVIKNVWNQLYLQNESSEEKISTLCNELIESYYRQMEPRNRMVEVTPTDNVLDSNSLEYLVAVASRYANNVMHLARQIRQGPLDLASSPAVLQVLTQEHQKTQMFDQLLLGLTDVAENPEVGQFAEDAVPSESNEQPIFEDNTETTEGLVLIQEESSEISNGSGVSVTFEEEVQTTTETVVTSYKETFTY